MSKLDKLKTQYERLGKEIERLEFKTETVSMDPVPPYLEIHVADEKMTWNDATKYAKSLGDGWRLPTKFELQAIAESLDEKNELKQLICWSASTQSDTTALAWRVDLLNGDTNDYLKTLSFAVLCVR